MNDDTSVLPVNGIFTAYIGCSYSFRVSIKNGGSVTKVTVNGSELIAENGLYTVDNVTGDMTIDVQTTRDMYAPVNGIYRGVDVTKRSAAYEKPTWNSDKIGEEYITYQETVMFYSGRNSVRLLYPVENIITVYSYNLIDGERKYYYWGEDFYIDSDGKFVLTPDTSIPVYENAHDIKNITSDNQMNWSMISNWDRYQANYLIMVTYTHKEEWANTEYNNLADGNEMVLGAHMLEVCPSVAGTKPEIKVMPLGIGGKESPARLTFDGAEGDAICVSLVDMGGRMRMIVQDVKAYAPLNKMPNLPVAGVMWKPLPDLQTAAECWILAGGAHHTVLSYALNADNMRDFAEMLGIEFVHITADTKVSEFKKELLWNDVAYKIGMK